ncbi:glutathione synthase [Acaryochloris marina]|uniref:Glutathione synthetase n=1 Tax=Acaryochloris marina (strain MBIC 11017) TaxID=329726 RepID=B0CE56_ACAM1|nr:glutathione synthase [Acaryochloris marina]ABW30530.1 glutathione synthase [Acaryochloris marina MBIC11017]BDM79333.1 glutathione synthetase [Acaryochloris marina MBIC10699]
MKLAFIIDPISALDPGHDTSVALMESAQAAGYEVWITQFDQLSVLDGQAWATLTPVSLKPVELIDGLWVATKDWFVLGDAQFQPLANMDAVWMRKDPPVTVSYLYTTYLLDYVNPQQTLLINHPRGLRAANEKMYALQFQGAIPETIVSQDKSVILQFVQDKGMAVLKPLGGKAGEGILLLQAEDRNLNSLIEISTRRGQEPVMVQVYLPEAQQGDKRIILLDGEPIGAVNRVPRGQEFRGNMATGGRVVQAQITDQEKSICSQLGPVLKRDGLMFVGIDIIGGYLTEVNVTSPTGIREIDRLDNTSLGEKVMHWLVTAKQGLLH